MTSMLENIMKDIDPVVAGILNDALDSKNISVKQAVELFDTTGAEINAIMVVSDILRKSSVGDIVTYVVNRNINFTNVCIKKCGFCAFSRDFRNQEGYFLPVEEIVRRTTEAWKLGATEVCIQAGLAPKMDRNLYVTICEEIKKAHPEIHIHAFSPEEVKYAADCSGYPVEEYLKMLKDAGVGSLPGTAAEILNQEVRDIISPGRISVKDWINVIKCAHRLNIPTTSTIMYGHIESSLHKAEHLELIRSIQNETKGFTEFVPLSFIYKEAPMYFRNSIPGIRQGPDGNEIIKMHAISRIMLNNCIKNIQVSWVKEGVKMSQILLSAGVNDFGGTLMNESISTSAGAENGQMMKPKEIHLAIKSAGKTPAQRSSTYRILKKFSEGEEDPGLPLDNVDPTKFGSYQELIKIDKYRYAGIKR
ncbi:MAG: 5-amino-6-(D-ribitylamino)uracil--L-tyrosine 4-hydroxyphenyl transferase CofH [Thermoproteota archaeon]|nr:5-amino-6-(D-ribitylamino)uracil--L-tyrosine 4-hydroxyphenyl transferase CofH [Thermoproteota archaeon]